MINNSKRVFAFIFARGGSKGLPDKNILSLDGVPLVTRAIATGQALSRIERIFVSTDSNRISELSTKAGAEVIIRPPELATDESPEWLSWQHAIRTATMRHGQFDLFVSIPAIAPLRKSIDISHAIDAFTSDADIVLTVTESRSNPMFSMVKINDLGYVELLTTPDKTVKRRQDAPPVYDIVPVAYVSTPQFITNSTSIWDGRVKSVHIPQARAVDIDTELDFRFAEFLASLDRS
jgi:CMP-N-acetylneuraminic acid synthetase